MGVTGRTLQNSGYADKTSCSPRAKEKFFQNSFLKKGRFKK